MELDKGTGVGIILCRKSVITVLPCQKIGLVFFIFKIEAGRRGAKGKDRIINILICVKKNPLQK